MAYSGSVFKSVCDDILEPRGVKVGGYKDEIFDNLSEKEREDISCQICFMVAKDAHWCTNKHLFCAACIYAWSMTGEGNTDRCPVCRVRGSYCEEDSINARINNMAIKCTKCKWKGQVVDYRAHSHGLDEVGINPKLAELPGVWSSSGDSIFPDLGTNETLDETVETCRRRHQRRYLDAQLDLIDGQARLAFLLDIFEEDLARHRANLNTLVRVQQRYNAEQFNEVMRLESELGQITSNLLHLIDNASSDVDMMTNRLRGQGLNRAPVTNPGNSAISSTISRLRSQRTELSSIPSFPLRASRHREVREADSDLPSRTLTGDEQNQPIRRSRFFRVNSRINTNPSQTDLINTETAAQGGALSTGTESTQLTSSGTGRLLNRRTTESHTETSGVANSYTQQRITPNLVRMSNQETVNPFSITYPPTNPQPTNNRHIPTISPAQTIRQSRQMPTVVPNTPETTRVTTPILPQRVTGASTTLTPCPPRDSTSTTPVAPRTGATNAVSGNPFTITWPPAGDGVQSGGITHRSTNSTTSLTRRVSRQELRRLGRSDRDT